MLSSVVDISARRLLEERLRQAQKMEAIGTLAGGVAHDFNNLLRAIVGYSELVATKLTSTQALADLDQVRRAAERGQQLVQRILAFSRHRELTRKSMDLSRPLEDAIQLLLRVAADDDRDSAVLHQDVPPVFADDTQVHQIVMNLVTNAAQALGDRPGAIDCAGTIAQGLRRIGRQVHDDMVHLHVVGEHRRRIQIEEQPNLDRRRQRRADTWIASSRGRDKSMDLRVSSRCRLKARMRCTSCARARPRVAPGPDWPAPGLR